MQNTVRAQFNLHKETFSDVEAALLWIKKMTRTSGEVAIASWYQIGNGRVIMA
jgi:hypothetical protein